MAIFSKNKKKKDKRSSDMVTGSKDESIKSGASGRVESPADNSSAVRGLKYNVILHPRITEKATEVSEDHNVYVFDVNPRATKQEIKKEIKKQYNVEPVKVRTSKIAKKKSSVRGINEGMKGGGKKAYVYLKKGDTIEII